MAKKLSKADEKLHNADLKHFRETEKYVKMVEALYQKAIYELSALAVKVDGIPMDKSFSFAANPAIAKEVDEVVSKLAGRITAAIESGARKEWDAACAKSSEYVESILKTSKLTKTTLQRYQDRNLAALAAFQERKVEGLNLSERVWKHVAPLKDEVEMVTDTTKKYYKHGINSSKSLTKIERALGTGMSAADLSREVRSCLKEPNKLFRRVKDKYGNLHLSKAAKAYHPGQGVYRSSYKNAMRLTRSEINMAYRQSDHMRWQQLDFVVGMEVHTSNNHPESDLCDCLKGKYPKDFKFVGWHPQCRCFVTPILKDYEQWNKDRENIGNPEYKEQPSAEEVRDVPQGFRAYVKDNEERMKGWKSTPYYLKDNPQYVDMALHPEKYVKAALVLSDDVQKKLSDFEIYGFNHQGSSKFNNALNAAKEAVLKGDQKAFDDAMAEMERVMSKNEASTASKAAKKKKVNTSKHDYDARIAELLKWAKAYELDLTSINKAYKDDDVTSIAQEVSKQENLLADRKQMVYDAIAKYEKLGGEEKFLVNERNNYRQLLNLINAEIKEIEDFNREMKALENSYREALREGVKWGVREDWIEDIEQYRKRRNIFGVRSRIRDINNELDKIRKEYASYIVRADNAIRDAKRLNIDSSAVKADLAVLKNDVSEWKNIKSGAFTNLTGLESEIEEKRRASGVDSPNPAMKKQYSKESDVDDTINEINKGLNGDRWLEKGDCKLTKTYKSGVNGFTYMDGRISLKPDRVDRVRSAMAKIGNGRSEDITFEEADAMATFWHEITHNRNKYGNMYLTEMQTKVMELANEYVARHTLPEFYGKMGCAKTPHPEFITDRKSTGYNTRVTNFQFVVSKLKLEENKVLDTVKRYLFDHRYDEQESGLMQALLDGGIKYASDINSNGKKRKTMIPKESELKRLVKAIRDIEDSYEFVGHNFVMKKKDEKLEELLKDLGLL